eukprot:4104679-Amphidinium_carterae.1
MYTKELRDVASTKQMSTRDPAEHKLADSYLRQPDCFGAATSCHIVPAAAARYCVLHVAHLRRCVNVLLTHVQQPVRQLSSLQGLKFT